MADIQILDKQVWSKIAAGEVVEKPASIVKELVENSIDANAKNIIIEIADGGTSTISITDDGDGIKKDQIELAFVPHATSKLKNIEDLYNLNSMGFRGEALASICAVSNVELTSKTRDEDIGCKIILSSGEKQSISQFACKDGTNITVSNLFFNTPARAKFLRKNKLEENDITNYVEKLMLSHSDINFKYIVDGKMIYNTTNCSIIDIIYTIYGKDIADNMIEVNYSKNDYNVSGYICKPTVCKSNRTYQTLFVNNRYFVNSMIGASISNAYEDFLMKGKFPVFVLFLNMPKNCVDVNVHPNKLEVKFNNSQFIYGLFNNAVYDALSKETHIKDALNDDEFIFDTKKDSTPIFNKIDKNEGVSFNQVNFDKTNNVDDLNKSNVSFDAKNLKIDEFYDRHAETFGKPRDIEFCQSVVDYKPFVNEVEIKATENLESISDDFKIISNDNKSKQQKELQTYQNLFQPTRTIVGVAFTTYIIVQEENTLYFIDQHAAHERQLFDKFMEQVENQNVATQELLIPYILKVNDYENAFIEDNINLLNSYGFTINLFGKNVYRVTSVPMLLNEIDLRVYFNEILNNLNGIIKKPQDVIRLNFATMACKSAIKAGKILSNEEINILLDKLKENNNTLLCPHGRPIVITFDKKQIEKMFKRIV